MLMTKNPGKYNKSFAEVIFCIGAYHINPPSITSYSFSQRIYPNSIIGLCFEIFKSAENYVTVHIAIFKDVS